MRRLIRGYRTMWRDALFHESLMVRFSARFAILGVHLAVIAILITLDAIRLKFL